MNKFKKYLLLLPVITVVSCGYYVDYLVKGDMYISINFSENYYRHWDNELKNAKKVEEIVLTDGYITSFNKLEQIDPNFALEGAPKNDLEYGEEYKMNSVDDSFNYGYQSKLFDGHTRCGGIDHPDWAYQKGRVQIDDKGFSIRFSKESDTLQYFALQFKASTDNTKDCYPVGSTEISHAEDGNAHDVRLIHSSVIDLNITLYVKTSKGIVGHPFVSTLTLDATNNGSAYVFYAFDLSNLEKKLTRLVGVSVTYDYDDELINWNKKDGRDIDLDYALLLYEMFFPYTSWN